MNTDDNPQTDPSSEIKAMQSVADALVGLDVDARGRVIRWAAERFSVATGKVQTSANEQTPGKGEEVPPNTGDSQEFEDLTDLYSHADPSTEPDKVLVVGYWFQYLEGLPEFDSQSVNSRLKHLGHGVKNVTAAFTSLKGRKPALVMQTKKSGSSQQARKRYKLTTEGKKTVEAMLSNK